MKPGESEHPGIGVVFTSLNDRSRDILARLTSNRLMGAATGAFVTAVIQSSSVTTVLVVGFITAGLMSMAQSIGIIMGANIGTTITAQIIAFKVTKAALLMVAIGFAMLFVTKNERIKQYGTMLMGLGLVFFGMSLMSDAMKPLRSYQPFLDLMIYMEDPVVGILIAAAFTGLVQSSSATTGIVIVMASQGFITLPAGVRFWAEQEDGPAIPEPDWRGSFQAKAVSSPPVSMMGGSVR